MLNDQQMRERCEALVVSIVGQESAKTWWNSPNYQFGMIPPNKAWSMAPGLVYDYLLKHSEL